MDLLPNNREAKRNLVLYFQVHQPKRLSTLRFFDIGAGNSFFDDELNRTIIQRVARECYLPANALLLKLIRKNPGMRVSFSLSGVIIDQFEEYAPEVLDSFRALAATGSVEFLSETYYHSLACMMPGREFEAQVLKHAEKIYEHFGMRPTVFRNTELIYNDDIGRRVSKLGFEGIVTDGIERLLENRSPNHLYAHPSEDHLKILLRNYRLSDDIAFRFSADDRPLSSVKYISWLKSIPREEELITLALDYETFGEHHKKDSGIFKFLEEFLVAVARDKTFNMLTPAQAAGRLTSHGALHAPQYVSWADRERDLSAWLGNEMQRDAFDSVLKMEIDVKNLDDDDILEQWRCLLTSDHFYYMSTKKESDGMVHSYFSPYQSPYEAFINYMNVLTDFSMKVQILRAGKIAESKAAGIQDLAALIEGVPQSMGSRMTMLSAY